MAEVQAVEIPGHKPGRDPRNAGKAGFTLIELLVAVAILGILGTVVIREIWGAIDEARQTSTKAKVDSIESVVQQFRRKHNRLPSDLEELTQPDDLHNGEPWLSDDDLRDAWGKMIVLVPGERSNQFDIVSYGMNGQPDGFEVSQYGLDADISSSKALQEYED